MRCPYIPVCPCPCVRFDLSIVGGRRFYQDTGRFRGGCTLRCHGVEHVNFTYEP